MAFHHQMNIVLEACYFLSLKVAFVVEQCSVFLNHRVKFRLGSFHLLRMLMDEYMFLAIETKLNEDLEKTIQENLDKNLKQGKVLAV